MAKTNSEIIDDVFKNTSEKLANKISALTRLTSEEAAKLIKDTKIDEESAKEMIEIIRDKTQSNSRKATSIKHITGAVEFLVGVATKAL